MPSPNDKNSMRDMVEFYKRQIEKELGARTEQKSSSREYQEFKLEYMPRHLTIYERMCNLSEKIMRMGPGKKKLPDMLESISISHLNITPSGVGSFSYLASLVQRALNQVKRLYELEIPFLPCLKVHVQTLFDSLIFFSLNIPQHFLQIQAQGRSKMVGSKFKGILQIARMSHVSYNVKNA